MRKKNWLTVTALGMALAAIAAALLRHKHTAA